MNEMLYPYLLAIIATTGVLMGSWFAYLRYQRAAIDHQEKAQRIPDFVRYVQLSDQIDDLERRREDLQQELGQAEATVAEASEARLFLDQHGDVIQQARQSLEQLQKTESELVALHEQLGILKEEHRKSTEALARAVFDREEQQRRTEALRNEQQELVAAARGLRERTEALEASKLELLQETGALLERAGGLRAEVSGLEARKSQLEGELAKLEDRVGGVTEDLTRLTRETRELEGQLVRHQAELSPEPDGDSEALHDLREPLFKESHWPAASDIDDEDRALDFVAQHLRDHDLRFSKRVLHAFHTALKVQGEAPLLVLAGISGTGKSLLPQRYADAMGIHCHVVPVQPRWDGPQDLLGFYHHLERRFKATPLTRGLVQFDRFWQPRDESQFLGDRMLLVVLDEMNLARVEYYFSEFLSRLETRRDVDLDNEIERARAELVLELGATGAAQQTGSLFVDRNVLFVGTINEDESTQTLSDKVVDRANVLRFGRPAHLSRPAHGDTRQGEKAQGHLPWATWERWLREAPDLGGGNLELVERTAARLNDALGGLGRAFGHRTFRAILAYVQHYPVRTEQGVRYALADQVEQRILPKLRGLDPTEKAAGRALSEVLDVVHDLGDEPLEKAIEEGRDGHSFLWQGVEREGD